MRFPPVLPKRGRLVRLSHPINHRQPIIPHPMREYVTIESGDLRLEGALHIPEGGAAKKAAGVVLCHPHPRYGGDMDSAVVVGVANRLVAAGFAVLRFNFRGVGLSEGEFDWGGGETDDAEAAADFLALRDEVDAGGIGIAGYSFGAAVAMQAAMGMSSVQALAALACPAPQMRAFSGLEILPPKLFVLGDNDHEFPVDQFRFLCRRFSEPREYEVLAGADHFFRGFEDEVGKLCADFFARRLRR